MSAWAWIGVAAAVCVATYAALVLALVRAGRRSDARALAGFIPDCAILFRRLLADPRVPRPRKALVVLLLGYLALPFDLIPDFIPIAGQLDDAILAALVLRAVVGGAGREVVEEHWPGPPASRDLILRLAPSRPPRRPARS
jgi:uncharacterized membrane protein YkvA (DUF1232 family)